MKLHHYGFATKSIDKSLKEFEKIGYTAASEKIIDPIQGVELLFIGNDTNHLIELVSPLDKNDSPVTKILQKNGASLYHICYEVEDLDVTIEDFKKKKFLLVLAPTPAVAFNNRRISFMYNTHLGLIEFLEK
ncbi:VOC family protein [Riemerella anatipestifer]|nr:VOC family protein [Riemerella anatipestifer]